LKVANTAVVYNYVRWAMLSWAVIQKRVGMINFYQRWIAKEVYHAVSWRTSIAVIYSLEIKQSKWRGLWSFLKAVMVVISFYFQRPTYCNHQLLPQHIIHHSDINSWQDYARLLANTSNF
jgi:hypothetical protein